jgi:hypothetical protein
MRKAIVVRGRLRGPRIIELEEPVEGVDADVEVVLRESESATEDDPESLIAVLRRDEVDAALARTPLEVQLVYRAPLSPSNVDEVTESPVVLARRVPSAPMRAAADVREERDTPVDLVRPLSPDG